MVTENGTRPQDQGRKHRRSGSPSDATTTLLSDAYGTLRGVLRRTLEQLDGRDNGTGLDGQPMPREYPSLAATEQLVRVARSCMDTLGTEVDTPAEPEPDVTRTRRRRIEY